ncbi:hypothetical protein [Streptomyces syringium]|uniref:hypothetical protein n=1 Tax=Streptomyces syringium TaxID=76729 RepID=UPI00345395A7
MTAQPTERARPRDTWFYPAKLNDDLLDSGLSHEMADEALACAWEYVRCIVPEFTNWDRYLALVRIIALATVAEVRGSLVDVSADDHLLGYDLDELLDTLFAGTPGHHDMARECRANLLISAEKSSDRRGSELFRRYANAVAWSPHHWIRLRDCDALARFTIAGALACNNMCDAWFSEEEWHILAGLGDTLYDAVAYYKHRAEGETNNTFAYAGPELRSDCFRRYREVLWALDTTAARDPKLRVAVNFVRPFGGPIQMMMRRYRFTDDGLTIGLPETDHVVHQTRQNYKLWFRSDARDSTSEGPRYPDVIAQQEKLLFPGLGDMLEHSGTPHCGRCRYRRSYGAKALGEFGGVELCNPCRDEWRAYLTDFPNRAAGVFRLSPPRQPRRPLPL